MKNVSHWQTSIVVAKTDSNVTRLRHVKMLTNVVLKLTIVIGKQTAKTQWAVFRVLVIRALVETGPSVTRMNVCLAFIIVISTQRVQTPRKVSAAIVKLVLLEMEPSVLMLTNVPRTPITVGKRQTAQIPSAVSPVLVMLELVINNGFWFWIIWKSHSFSMFMVIQRI